MASDDISQNEVSRLRALRGAARTTMTLNTIAATGVLWVWGDHEDTLFTEDADGTTVLPVWPHAALAEAECGGDPTEHPIEVALDRFLEVWLPQLAEDDAAIAVCPVENRIAVTLDRDEFASKIAVARRAQRSA